MNKPNTVVTLSFGSSKLEVYSHGGVVLHTGQSENNCIAFFEFLRKQLDGPNGFNQEGEPTIFITDDSTAERKTLQTCFSSATLFLC